ncbi:ABC transporter permease [Aquamicrobium terrae]|uniref:Spermidine/putrescine transport system permease protein n=1 Tax=Aquamicrobium terrae TaxID=1324945 RepID=A0ABV2N171_9HYPH
MSQANRYGSAGGRRIAGVSWAMWGADNMRTTSSTLLKAAHRKAQRPERLRGFLLIAPLAVFLAFTFLAPISSFLVRAVYDPLIADAFPNTVDALKSWKPSEGTPPEAVFRAFRDELLITRDRGTIGAVGQRLNRDAAGMRSLVQRGLSITDQTGVTEWKPVFVGANEQWALPETWSIIKNAGSRFTLSHLLQAVDLVKTEDGSIELRPEDQRVNNYLLVRTLLVGLAIMTLSTLLAFPIALAIARASPSAARWMMTIVLLQFWTSVLARIVSWIVLLQNRGVVNDLLVATGVIAEQQRLALIYNMLGTILVGTYAMLPLVILPIYSVMKLIPPSYLRAATSLGAHPFEAFWRVYFPLTLPGIGAGASTAFILSIGYFVTPALVGGQSGTLYSNIIAYHMQTSLNWALAAALSIVILVVVISLYTVLNRYMRDRKA